MRKSSRAMSIRGSAFSTPWLQFHGGGAADVYIIIRVRACCCGESALNPPTSQPIPVEDLLPPRTATRTARAFSHPLPAHFSSPPAPTHPRRLRHAFPAEDLRSPPLFRFGHKKNGTAQWMCDAFPADLTTHSPPKPSARPAQRHALPEHFRSPTQRRCIPRRPHNPFPTEDLRPSPQRHAASPSVPLRAQKNGTAQCMCDAECLGRPSLRSVIWVGEPRAVRRRCGALACRRGA